MVKRSDEKRYDGDYTDPRKSKEVDASYDKGYLARRDKLAEDMRNRMRKGKRKGGK